MKKRVYLIYLCLILVIAAACGPGVYPVPAPTEAPAEPPKEQPVEPVTEVPDTETPAEPVVEQPPAQGEPKFPPPDEPRLPQLQKPRLEFFKGMDKLGVQVIGFTFPDGTIALKAATFEDMYSYPYGYDESGVYTPVGMVEIGEGSDTGIPAGPYLVMLDLVSAEQFVPGEIRNLYDAGLRFPVNFIRVTQSLNWVRFDPSQTNRTEFLNLGLPDDSSVTITADGVCFILKTGDASRGEEYIRYCSEASSILSPRSMYKSKYEELMQSMGKTAEYFGLYNDIQLDQVISEMEDIKHIERCADMNRLGDPDGVKQQCGSDISVAPVSEQYFKDNYAGGYDKMKSQSFLVNRYPLAAGLALLFKQDDPFAGHFPVAVGTVQIYSQIDTAPEAELGDGSDLVEPGDYRLDYWFDPNGEFYAASISGYRYADNMEVINQPVPAVPATFVNADGTEQAPTQISTCRIFGRCVFFQRNCP